MTCMWLYIDIMIGKRLYAVGVLVAYPLKQAELLGAGDIRARNIERVSLCASYTYR